MSYFSNPIIHLAWQVSFKHFSPSLVMNMDRISHLYHVLMFHTNAASMWSGRSTTEPCTQPIIKFCCSCITSCLMHTCHPLLRDVNMRLFTPPSETLISVDSAVPVPPVGQLRAAQESCSAGNLPVSTNRRLHIIITIMLRWAANQSLVKS